MEHIVELFIMSAKQHIKYTVKVTTLASNLIPLSHENNMDKYGFINMNITTGMFTTVYWCIRIIAWLPNTGITVVDDLTHCRYQWI